MVEYILSLLEWRVSIPRELSIDPRIMKQLPMHQWWLVQITHTHLFLSQDKTLQQASLLLLRMLYHCACHEWHHHNMTSLHHHNYYDVITSSQYDIITSSQLLWCHYLNWLQQKCIQCIWGVHLWMTRHTKRNNDIKKFNLISNHVLISSGCLALVPGYPLTVRTL